MWKANGDYKKYELGTDVTVTNTYDPVRFNGDFSNLFSVNKYLEIVAGSAKFTYGKTNAQVNPYFKPEISTDGTIIIVKTQTENAPTADHYENLVFKVKDAYGHEEEISLKVTVQRPTKK